MVLQIFFLQEIHYLEQNETFGKRAVGVDCFFSHLLSNSCNVAILIRPNMSLDFRFVKHIVKEMCVLLSGMLFLIL